MVTNWWRIEIQFASSVFAAHNLSVMSDRELVLGTVQEMPETASLREIVDELLLMATVKERLARAEQGQQGVPHEEIVKLLDGWITK